MIRSVPITHAYRNHTLEIKVEGLFTTSYIFDVYEEAIRVYDLHSPTPVFIDVRDSERDPSAAEIQNIAERFAKLLTHIGPRFAVVAGWDELRYGLTRMFAMFAEMEGCQIQVFREDAEAWAWLRGKEVLE